MTRALVIGYGSIGQRHVRVLEDLGHEVAVASRRAVEHPHRYPHLASALDEIWLSDAMREIRLSLSRGDRSRSPCNKCSVDGTLHGGSSFERLMKSYAEQGKS